jgi:hypothetical protein
VDIGRALETVIVPPPRFMAATRGLTQACG